jgi:hypothetical protein
MVHAPIARQARQPVQRHRWQRRPRPAKALKIWLA